MPAAWPLPAAEQAPERGPRTVVLPESSRPPREQAGQAVSTADGPAPGRAASRKRWYLLAGALGLLALLGLGWWQLVLVPNAARQSALVLAAAKETFGAKTATANALAGGPTAPPVTRTPTRPQPTPTETRLPIPTVNPLAISVRSAGDFTKREMVGTSNLITADAYAFSGDGERAAVAVNGQTTVYDTESMKALYILDVDADKVALSPDGYLLAAVSGMHFTVYDISGEQALEKTFFSLASFGYLGLAFSPDQRLLFACDPASVFVFDLKQNGKYLTQFHTGTQITGAAFSPDGTRYAFTQLPSETEESVVARVFEIGKWEKPLLEIRAPKSCGGSSLAFSPDGQELAVGLCDSIAFWSMETYQPLERVIQTRAVHNLAYSSDGSVLAANSKYINNIMYLYDLQTGKEIASYPMQIFLTMIRGGEKIIFYSGGNIFMMGR